MLNARVRLRAHGESLGRDQLQEKPGARLRELFVPLDRLLISGGDQRLALDSTSGCNTYGCRPLPAADPASFSSSTATSISQRAFEAAGRARGALMQSAIEFGLDAAFDQRIEQMRNELKTELRLRRDSAEIVFSASGTDAQLQALFVARAVLDAPMSTIVVASDQTGSGTIHTSHGQNFSDVTGNGIRVSKGAPIEGLAEYVTSIALPLRDEAGNLRSQAENDALVLGAVERATAGRRSVLLQVMDSSKLGLRVPTDRCVQTIAARWPGQVQIVVDACQMRLSRRRLQTYLDRGYMVLITGSKYFTGPPFSGALLLPANVSAELDTLDEVAPGLLDYGSRYDWPKRWVTLRAQFKAAPNFGQWLRWEAALEEIRGYYAVPDSYRRAAIAELGLGIAAAIARSRSLRLLPQPLSAASDLDDDELLLPTIFPFTIEQQGRPLSMATCRIIHRALAAETGLIGQPVEWRDGEGQSVAALRLCVSARHVTESWSCDPDQTQHNMQQLLDAIAAIVAAIERLSQHYTY
jgi:hypothetical protein